MNKAKKVHCIMLGAALASGMLLTSLAVTPAIAAPAAAAVSTIRVKTVFIPEWYQYCHDTPPIGFTAGRYNYMNAYAEATGVTCKWWVMPRAGFPYMTKKFFKWDTVCLSKRSTYAYFKSGYPWCR